MRGWRKNNKSGSTLLCSAPKGMPFNYFHSSVRRQGCPCNYTVMSIYDDEILTKNSGVRDRVTGAQWPSRVITWSARFSAHRYQIASNYDIGTALPQLLSWPHRQLNGHNRNLRPLNGQLMGKSV